MGITGLSVLYDEFMTYEWSGSHMAAAKNTSASKGKTEEDVNPCTETLEDLDDVVDADEKDADFDAEESKA
jgi:iron uptake system EfeUOB component EfeO/EfeM